VFNNKFRFLLSISFVILVLQFLTVNEFNSRAVLYENCDTTFETTDELGWNPFFQLNGILNHHLFIYKKVSSLGLEIHQKKSIYFSFSKLKFVSQKYHTGPPPL
jgi:hypothetical protein